MTSWKTWINGLTRKVLEKNQSFQQLCVGTLVFFFFFSENGRKTSCACKFNESERTSVHKEKRMQVFSLVVCATLDCKQSWNLKQISKNFRISVNLSHILVVFLQEGSFVFFSLTGTVNTADHPLAELCEFCAISHPEKMLDLTTEYRYTSRESGAIDRLSLVASWH